MPLDIKLSYTDPLCLMKQHRLCTQARNLYNFNLRMSLTFIRKREPLDKSTCEYVFFIQSKLAVKHVTVMIFSTFQFSPRRILESHFPNGPLFSVTSDMTTLTFPDFDCRTVNDTSLNYTV
jgi:hypothetical protein